MCTLTHTFMHAYTPAHTQVIPHSFGRQVPPVINDDTMLREKVKQRQKR